jgi:small subunit ribosomal protein S1
MNENENQMPSEEKNNGENDGGSQRGPLNLAAIRQMRQLTVEPSAPKQRKPKHPLPRVGKSSVGTTLEPERQVDASPEGAEETPVASTPVRQESKPAAAAPKVEVPRRGSAALKEIDQELEAAFGGTDFGKLLVGDKNLQVGKLLEEGQRYPGKVIKVHQGSVFVSLGGANEGVIPLLQFLDVPQPGAAVECLVRAFNNSEGLYELSLPGEAVSVGDWSDLQEGTLVEAKVESANTGGLDCKVGNLRAFIPISQIAEYRIETTADYVGQKLMCVVTEANPRRGNLVISHRAVLEREKAEKKKERLANLQEGENTEGVVRKITDFGAFVDLGGLDGLIHISQMSWDRIKHPSEVLKEGEKIQVRIKTIDRETGKIGLTYRDLQDSPWADASSRFPEGSVHKGVVSRLAQFGAFVKLAPGVEGLVHLSEISHQRVTTPASMLKEGAEVEVKVISVDSEAQRISLSIKQAISKRSDVAAKPGAPSDAPAAPVQEEPKPTSSVKKHQGPLKGGTGAAGGGEKFGLRW